VIDLRRLAAVDVAFLGSKIILTEFAVGVLGPIVLGILTLRKSHSTGGMIFGVYVLLIGVNYVPMLIHAISIVNDGTARDEIADELDDKQRLFRKYRKQSLYLLVPLVAPIAAWMRRSARLP
jgi:hypothetical protein